MFYDLDVTVFTLEHHLLLMFIKGMENRANHTSHWHCEREAEEVLYVTIGLFDSIVTNSFPKLHRKVHCIPRLLK